MTTWKRIRNSSPTNCIKAVIVQQAIKSRREWKNGNPKRRRDRTEMEEK